VLGSIVSVYIGVVGLITLLRAPLCGRLIMQAPYERGARPVVTAERTEAVVTDP
jgi:hypothetical protein